jgi:hypothetical protein
VKSRLYTGWVMHERKVPKKNRFRYQLYYLFADLDELPDLDVSLKRFSYNRGNLVSFHDCDHGPRDGSPLRPWVDKVCAEADIDITGGRVQILAFPRVLGFKFYPVAFWYCYGADGTCRAVLAEVQNTFGEHHNYLLHNDGAPFDWRAKPETRKVFHVSPFITMDDARYQFRLAEPGEKLRLAIYDYVDGPLLLVAQIDLQSRPLTDRDLVRTVFRFGPMSARAWLLIHIQALKIVSKGIRYVPKPPPPQEETTLGR